MAATGEEEISTTFLKNANDAKGVTFGKASPEEMRTHSINNWHKWGDLFTSEAYLAREEMLRKTEAAEVGHEGWVLNKINEGEDSYIGACETLCHEAFVIKPCEQKAETVLCHNVGTVFTRDTKGKKGYGSTMIAMLAKRLRRETPRQTELKMDPAFSYLFSDIGPEWYARIGWRVMDNREFIQIPTPKEGVQSADLTNEPSDWNVEDIKVDFNHAAYPPERINGGNTGLEALKQLCGTDIELLKKRLENKQKENKRAAKETTLIAVKPTPEIFTWFWTREQFSVDAFKKPEKRAAIGDAKRLDDFGKTPGLSIKGAKVIWDGTLMGWILWTRMFYQTKPPPKLEDGTRTKLQTRVEAEFTPKPDCTLFILRIVFNDDAIVKALKNKSVLEAAEMTINPPKEWGSEPPTETEKMKFIIAKILLSRAYREAKDWKMDRTEIWRPKPEVKAAAKAIASNCIVGQKNEADIPSLCWFGEETSEAWSQLEKGPCTTPGMEKDSRLMAAFRQDMKLKFEDATKNIEWIDSEKYCWGV